MSAIEETLNRILKTGRVERYIIVDNSGKIIRTAGQQRDGKVGDEQKIAAEICKITQKARHVVRDLDPKNDLEFFRLKFRTCEYLVALGDAFTVIVIEQNGPIEA